MKQPLVSIIIVTYNSASYISRCLETLSNITYKSHEIIIVDNASTDSTVQLVKKDLVTAKIIKLKKNTGYAEGNNVGAATAQGRYLFFLNPDTEVTKNFLQPLVATLESDRQIVVAQPAVYLLAQKNQLNLTGKETHYLGMDWIKNYQSLKTPAARRIYSFSGSGFLISKESFTSLGGFDSTYFMYYEDTDLAWRINLAGSKIVFVPSSKLFHDYKFEPQEQSQTLKQKLFYAERNRLLTLLKNYSGKTLLILFPALLILELALFTYAVLSGWAKEKIESYVSIFNLRQSLLKERKKVQKNRIKSDKEIMKTMKSKISFIKYQHFLLTHILNPLFSTYYEIVMTFI